MRSFMKNILFAAASVTLTAGIVGFADPAIAVDTAAPQVSVATADLNLASPAGKATLDQRIQNAAARVCEDSIDRFAEGRCRAQAIDAAEHQVNPGAIDPAAQIASN